jgi:large subunit ribosomal protein L17
MRHRKASLKLNRTTSHREAMFRNMVTSLFKHERIRTTGAKAKELRRLAEHLITLAKRGDLHARRQALAVIREKDVVHKLFDEANEKFGHSAGGYTRIIKLGRRAGDAAPMSLIELIVPEAGGKKKAKKSAKAEAAKTKAGTPKKTEAKSEDKKKPAKKQTAAETQKKPKSKNKEASAQKEGKVKPKKTSGKKDKPEAKSAATKEKDSIQKPKKASKKKASKEEK